MFSLFICVSRIFPYIHKYKKNLDICSCKSGKIYIIFAKNNWSFIDDYDSIRDRATVLQGGKSPKLKRWEVVLMDTYEVLSLLFLGGSFLIALLAYIDRVNKRK